MRAVRNVVSGLGLLVFFGFACTPQGDPTSVRVAPLDFVPNELQQPGTQPGQVSSLESPDKCDNCHGGYNTSVEPAHNWRGGMMSQATRDPLFWATMAIAEQDFGGVGDLCLRCHSPDGWISGRSIPTNGQALRASDSFGVTCDLCHKLTNPDRSEWLGAQSAPFLAHDEQSPATGYYGSGQYVLWGGNQKLGPYADASARHQSGVSRFHREAALCGTCHDVSNPVVGDLAPYNGTLGAPLPDGTFGGTLGSPIAGKAAFNHFPFAYGVVERTFSEHVASRLSTTRIKDYPSLPAELQGGAIRAAWESACVTGPDCDYADGTPRVFSCQSCHMRPVTGQGCNKNPPVRKDLPLHDMTGGNYWAPDAIRWLDQRGLLRAGGGLTSAEVLALEDGKVRAQKQLSSAATLSVSGNILTVVNQTGHKLISGYPEGRRMWLNVIWYDSSGTVLREDGAYGALRVDLDGQTMQVRTLLDEGARIYNAHMAISPAWAQKLLTLGYSPAIPVVFDRVSGAVTMTLGDVAAASSPVETFHFALNDTVKYDNRIPPYGMRYDDAVVRNILPVPATQYGAPGPGGVFDHKDQVTLSPPANASYAKIRLLYQPTSWEYIQFLYLANLGIDPFLADVGDNLLSAWLGTGMAEPHLMAETTWGAPPAPPRVTSMVDSLSTWTVLKSGALGTLANAFTLGSTVGVRAHVLAAETSLSGAQVFFAIIAPSGATVANLQGFTDTAGVAIVKWKTARSNAVGLYSVRVTEVLRNGTTFDPSIGVTTTTFTLR